MRGEPRRERRPGPAFEAEVPPAAAVASWTWSGRWGPHAQHPVLSEDCIPFLASPRHSADRTSSAKAHLPHPPVMAGKSPRKPTQPVASARRTPVGVR